MVNFFVNEKQAKNESEVNITLFIQYLLIIISNQIIKCSFVILKKPIMMVHGLLRGAVAHPGFNQRGSRVSCQLGTNSEFGGSPPEKGGRGLFYY